MSNSYSPGLTVTSHTLIQRVRRLPIKGNVLVNLNESVTPDQTVARAMLPGLMHSVKVANVLGIEADEVEASLSVKVGDYVSKGTVLAQTSSFFGLFKSVCLSPVDGTIELFSHANGSIGIRQPANPLELRAYISGTVSDIIPSEGVIISAEGALIQGIFGVGGERTGTIRVVANSADSILHVEQIDQSLKNCIIVAGSEISAAGLAKAQSCGVAGVVVGGLTDNLLPELLGYAVGVATTGNETVSLTLIVSEGFGRIPMATRTFDLLKKLEGKKASINGATQIRAGVIRPEIIVPTDDRSRLELASSLRQLTIGTRIRMTRSPYFGTLGIVTDLPPNLCTIESGASVRVLVTTLTDGRIVTVPRANVEVLEGD